MGRVHVIQEADGTRREAPFTAAEDAARDVEEAAAAAAERPRDLYAEIAALTAKLARSEKLEAVLIEKALLAKGELDAKV